MEEETASKTLKRTVKDSVFTDLFGQKRYLIQLYQSLHPEDAETEEDDITIVTIQNIITDGLYNDLGFMVRDRLVVLVEAQSTWSPNIVVRALMYLMKTYNDYFTERDVDLYASKKIDLPCPELYVVYTGDKKDVPDSLSLSQEFFAGQSLSDQFCKNLLCKFTAGFRPDRTDHELIAPHNALGSVGKPEHGVEFLRNGDLPLGRDTQPFPIRTRCTVCCQHSITSFAWRLVSLLLSLLYTIPPDLSMLRQQFHRP